MTDDETATSPAVSKCGVGKASSIISKEVWGISAASIEQPKGLQDAEDLFIFKLQPGQGRRVIKSLGRDKQSEVQCTIVQVECLGWI
ncbi:hypothetical protein RIR_jg5191.t1 [Rhizophagus irregularis DAOM 181602=DAOM 197198]|nr:hypothetical protein RIR_jg5191.t1 [Rhizophagus irregularis DAOM 181602=DAOM 197198]